MQVELERELEEAMAREMALLERALSAERELEEAQESVQWNSDLVEEVKDALSSAAASAKRRVRSVTCMLLHIRTHIKNRTPSADMLLRLQWPSSVGGLNLWLPALARRPGKEASKASVG